MAAPLVSVSGRVEEGIGQGPEGAPTPDAVVAVYASEKDLTAAITIREKAKFDMANHPGTRRPPPQRGRLVRRHRPGPAHIDGGA